MRKRLRGIVLLLAGVASLAWGDDPLLLHPDRVSTLAELQGRVQAVDRGNRWVNIEDERGAITQLRVTPETRITNNDNRDLTLAALGRDTAVRVWYNTVDHSAQQIDRLPSLTETLLGRN